MSLTCRREIVIIKIQCLFKKLCLFCTIFVFVKKVKGDRFMKKRLITFLLLTLISVIALSACDLTVPGKGEKPDKGKGEEEEDLIFDEDSELYFITDEYSALSSSISEAANIIDSHKKLEHSIKYADKSSAPAKHEIIFGKSDREVSRRAEMQLGRIEKNNDTDVRYIVYSDGSSISVLYDEDGERIAIEAALKALIAVCDTDKLILSAGVVKLGVIDVYEYYSVLDDEYEAVLWKELAEKVGGRTGENFVSAMKELYSLYTSDMVMWIAGLYEPSICVCNGLYGELECSHTKYCGTAGFYYSNSARDNIGYLPDAESTYQALTLLNSTGITRKYGSSWTELLDKDMLEGILAFIRSLQREDGYFVHPQWQDPGTSRISRDLSWSTTMLGLMKRSPYYTTPTGIQGIGAPKSASALKGELRNNVISVSSVISASSEGHLSQLKDVPTFINYLNALDVKNNSYSAGNTLTSMASQITARDRELGLSGEGSLYMTMINHLNACQNPENGTWYFKNESDSDYDIYYAVNGLMKVTGVYGDVHPIQYVDKAIETAISAITYDKDITGAVDIYNPWFALTNIFTNLEGCGGEEGLEIVKETRQRLYESASETLSASRRKISVFKKEDGSFSYHPDRSSETSQGCAAAVPNSNEGDINGNVLSSSGLINHIYDSLGLADYQVPLFGECERLMFMNGVRGTQHMNKPNVTVSADPEGFESYDAGDVPPNSGLFSSKTVHHESYIKVAEREDGEGNALEVCSKPNSSDHIYIKNPTKNQSAAAFVFEGDFKIDYSSKSCPVRVALGSAYMFSFVITDDTVHIVEMSSELEENCVQRDLGAEIPLSQWFGVRVEYYRGDHDSVRIKFYLDADKTDETPEELITVTDNYYDRAGNKLNVPKGTPASTFTETAITVLADTELLMQLDNLVSYMGVEKYIPEKDGEGKLHYNIDSTSEEKSYGFDDGVLPEEFLVSGSGISITDGEDKALRVSSPQNSTLTIPVNNVFGNGDCLSVSFELLCVGGSEAETVMTLTEREEGGGVVGYAFVCENDSLGSHLKIYDHNGSLGAEIKNVRIPLGRAVTVRIDNYGDHRTSIFYIDGEFVATSTALFEGGNKLRATEARFEFLGGASSDIRIDDLKAERNLIDYLEEVKPERGSVCNDFEGKNEGIVFGAGSSVYTYAGNKVARLDSSLSSSELTVPVNSRSKVCSAISVQLDLMYRKATENGVSHTVTVNDSEGNLIFGVLIAINGGKAELYEITRQGEPRLLLTSFEYSPFMKIGFDVYLNEKCAYIYAGGKCLILTECFPAMENIGNEAVTLNIRSGSVGSVLYVDNVVFDTLYLGFEKKTTEPLEQIKKDTGALLDFEKNALHALPARLYTSTNTGGRVVQNVKTLLNKVTGEYSNVLIYSTKAGSNDGIGVSVPEGESALSGNAVVFEADFRMDIKGGSDAYKFWFFMSQGGNKSSEIAYQVLFIVRNGKLCFEDRSANSGWRELKVDTGLSADEWHHMKLEYFKGDSSTARIRMSLDGKVIYVSSDYFGNKSGSDALTESRTDIRNAFFYSIATTEAELYLDNMTLYESDDTCTDTVGKK